MHQDNCQGDWCFLCRYPFPLVHLLKAVSAFGEPIAWLRVCCSVVFLLHGVTKQTQASAVLGLFGPPSGHSVSGFFVLHVLFGASGARLAFFVHHESAKTRIWAPCRS